MSQGSVYTCKNHPLLRWFDTKPNGRLCFAGEIPTEDHPTGKPDMGGGIPPFKTIKARIIGYNPFLGPNYEHYDEKDKKPTITTFEELVKTVESYQSMMQTWSFECECPGADLVKVEGERYEDKIATISLPPKDES